MFTGFASENTPAIQVWDFYTAFASTAVSRRIALADDCAPIQFFKTGATASAVLAVYLPTAPVEGKQIKIINASYASGAVNQVVYLYSSDTSNGGSNNVLAILGPGQYIDLIYSKNFIYVGNSGGAQTGWVSLNQTPVSAYNFSSFAVGYNNAALSSYTVSLGGTGNTASSSYASTVGGTGSTASGQYSSVVGGLSHAATGSGATIIGGSTNTANNTYAGVFGGSNHTSNGINSSVLGGAYGTARGIAGNTVFPASVSPITVLAGVSQVSKLALARQTTDATATTLTSNTSVAGTSNQVTLPNNSAYYFRGSVIANVTGGGDTKAWTIEGAIKRGASAATTALVGTPTVTSSYADAGAAAWAVAVTANTTSGCIQVNVTGAAATTIRWVCTIETTEVTF